MEEQASWSALYSAHTLPQISKLELAVILQCARLLPVATMVFLYSALPHSRSTDTLSPLPNMKTEIRPFMRIRQYSTIKVHEVVEDLEGRNSAAERVKRPIREPSLTGMSV